MPADLDSCELLRAIVRLPAEGATQQIGQLARNVRDWDSLVALAQEHRVLPMLFLRLDDLGTAVPLAVQDHLQAEYNRNVFHSLANAAELIDLLKAFDHEAIPAMPFKGVVLGASAYGNLTTRPAGDLDVIIHHRHLERVTAILLKRGYELQTPLHADGTEVFSENYEYHFERQADGMVTEIRWRLGHNLNLDWVWPHRRVSRLAGAEVPNMGPETALLILCMHGIKHEWSRLIWICDIAQLLASSPDINWKEVIQEAKRLGLRRVLGLAVLLAHQIVGTELPKDVLRRFEADSVTGDLAKHFQETLFDQPDSSLTDRQSRNLRLFGFRDRLSMFMSPHFLRPNERDLAALSLPKPLHSFYYVVRIVRILWNRSAG